MANLRSIKRRIKSAKNVSQITYAMEMVAASKMKKAQNAALSGRPYALGIAEAVAAFATKNHSSAHPLLQSHPTGTDLIILITSNKGLVGGLNLNLFKYLNSSIINHTSPRVFITVGKKGAAYLTRTRENVVADFSESHLSSIASALPKLVIDNFTAGQYKSVYLAYNHFVSSLKQEPTFKQLLPIAGLPNSAPSPTILVEPSKDAVFNALLSDYVAIQILDALRQSEASEYSARMVTMKAATDSAHDFITALTLQYNQARQSSVTSEISDIITARLASA